MRNGTVNRIDREYFWFAVLLLIILTTSVNHAPQGDSGPAASDAATDPR